MPSSTPHRLEAVGSHPQLASGILDVVELRNDLRAGVEIASLKQFESLRNAHDGRFLTVAVVRTIPTYSETRPVSGGRNDDSSAKLLVATVFPLLVARAWAR